MKRNRTEWILTYAAGMLAVFAASESRMAAQQASEERIHELVRLVADRPTSHVQTGTLMPAPAQTPSTTRPVVRLTLEEAVTLALERNLDITVQRLNPQAADFSMAALRSAYLPVVGSTLGSQTAVTPATSTVSGAPVGTGISAGQTTFSGGLAQNVPWGGGALSATLNNTRSTTTSATALFNPVYNPSWTFQLVQPLIRGLAIDSNRQQIVVTKLNRDISELQLQSTITNTLSSVREAYWNAVYTAQAVEVAQQSVDIAEQLVQDNRARVEIGIMAAIDVLTARSQAAQQRQALVQAEANRRTSELALKRLLVRGTQDPLWGASIDPTDRPDFRPEAIDVEAAIRKALSARTDLNVARKSVEANAVTLKYLRNQALPQADLVARYGLAGLGGTQYIATGSGINRVVSGVIPGGFSDALSTLLGRDYPTWSVSLNLSYPLGTNIVAAQLARARVQAAQVDAQTHQIELQIATDVTNAATNIQSAVEAVQAALAAQDLAQETYEAEQAKFDVGISTNYNVILTQRDLNTARNSYLLAVLNYRNALVELDRLQQTTLQSVNVTLLSPGLSTGAVSSPALSTGAVGSGCPTTSTTPCVP
jgi:outer membrane protein